MLTTPRSRCGAKPPEERKAGGKYILSIAGLSLFFFFYINYVFYNINYNYIFGTTSHATTIILCYLFPGTMTDVDRKYKFHLIQIFRWLQTWNSVCWILHNLQCSINDGWWYNWWYYNTALNDKLQNYNAHAIRAINIPGFIISQDFFFHDDDIWIDIRSEDPHSSQ